MVALKATHPNSSQAGWQILAELDLAAESNRGQVVREWLAKALSPLDLDRSLEIKLLNSAPEAAAAATKLDNAGSLPHLRFLILIPSVYEDRGQAWGFFRLVKTGGPAPGPVIEFYLYPEGP